MDHIQDMLDAMDAEPADFWGLRVIDGEAPALESVLAPSYRWDDGEWTADVLDGVSTIGIRETRESIERALMLAGVTDAPSQHGYYPGRTVVLVRGDRGMRGEDEGELVIRDGIVTRIYRKRGDGRCGLET